MPTDLIDIHTKFFAPRKTGQEVTNMVYAVDNDEITLSHVQSSAYLDPINGQATFPRYAVTTGVATMTSGDIRGTHFVCNKSRMVTKMSAHCGTTAFATPTTAKFGVYSVDRATGIGTLLCVSANTTTLLNTANTISTVAMVTPAEIIAGGLYAAAMIFVGTTPPTPHAHLAPGTSFSGVGTTKFGFVLAGQTDLIATLTNVNMANGIMAPYFELMSN